MLITSDVLTLDLV